MDFPWLIWKHSWHTAFGEKLWQPEMEGLENELMEMMSHLKVDPWSLLEKQ